MNCFSMGSPFYGVQSHINTRFGHSSITINNGPDPSAGCVAISMQVISFLIGYLIFGFVGLVVGVLMLQVANGSLSLGLRKNCYDECYNTRITLLRTLAYFLIPTGVFCIVVVLFCTLSMFKNICLCTKTHAAAAGAAAGGVPGMAAPQSSGICCCPGTGAVAAAAAEATKAVPVAVAQPAPIVQPVVAQPVAQPVMQQPMMQPTMMAQPMMQPTMPMAQPMMQPAMMYR